VPDSPVCTYLVYRPATYHVGHFWLNMSPVRGTILRDQQLLPDGLGAEGSGWLAANRGKASQHLLYGDLRQRLSLHHATPSAQLLRTRRSPKGCQAQCAAIYGPTLISPEYPLCSTSCSTPPTEVPSSSQGASRPFSPPYFSFAFFLCLSFRLSTSDLGSLQPCCNFLSPSCCFPFAFSPKWCRVCYMHRTATRSRRQTRSFCQSGMLRYVFERRLTFHHRMLTSLFIVPCRLE
jgi:hypothetical protein